MFLHNSYYQTYADNLYQLIDICVDTIGLHNGLALVKRRAIA